MTELIKIDKAMVESFEINLIDVQKMVDEYQTLTLKPDDKESYQVCRTALTACVRNRTSIDKRRLELNAEDHARIKKRNGVAKQLTNLIFPAESHLSKLVKGEDRRVEEIKAEIAQKEQARVDAIQEMINEITSLTASLHLQPDFEQLNDILTQLESIEITPEIFQEFTAQANESKADTRTVLLKAVDARKEFEAKEQALRVENERIKKANAELDAKYEQQAKEQIKIDEEKKKFEQEKFEKEATEKAEREAREKLEQEQKEKEEQEKRDAIEKERLEALKPDVEKLISWIDRLDLFLQSKFHVSELKLNNSNAIDVFRSIQAKGNEFIKYARERINEL